jgi:hypothetical protein
MYSGSTFRAPRSRENDVFQKTRHIPSPQTMVLKNTFYFNGLLQRYQGNSCRQKYDRDGYPAGPRRHLSRDGEARFTGLNPVKTARPPGSFTPGDGPLIGLPDWEFRDRIFLIKRRGGGLGFCSKSCSSFAVKMPSL